MEPQEGPESSFRFLFNAFIMNQEIKAVIIDDEQDSIDTLSWKLENYCPSVTLVHAFTKPEEGLQYLKAHQIDILFLDIEMPRLNGFDVLQELGSFDFQVIFVTAYDEFGIQAIKFSALDYLLKPVQITELKGAVAKIEKRDRNSNADQVQFEMLFKNLELLKFISRYAMS